MLHQFLLYKREQHPQVKGDFISIISTRTPHTHHLRSTALLLNNNHCIVACYQCSNHNSTLEVYPKPEEGNQQATTAPRICEQTSRPSSCLPLLPIIPLACPCLLLPISQPTPASCTSTPNVKWSRQPDLLDVALLAMPTLAMTALHLCPMAFPAVVAVPLRSVTKVKWPRLQQDLAHTASTSQ